MFRKQLTARLMPSPEPCLQSVAKPDQPIQEGAMTPFDEFRDESSTFEDSEFGLGQEADDDVRGGRFPDPAIRRPAPSRAHMVFPRFGYLTSSGEAHEQSRGPFGLGGPPSRRNSMIFASRIPESPYSDEA